MHISRCTSLFIFFPFLLLHFFCQKLLSLLVRWSLVSGRNFCSYHCITFISYIIYLCCFPAVRVFSSGVFFTVMYSGCLLKFGCSFTCSYPLCCVSVLMLPLIHFNDYQSIPCILSLHQEINETIDIGRII